MKAGNKVFVAATYIAMLRGTTAIQHAQLSNDKKPLVTVFICVSIFANAHPAVLSSSFKKFLSF
jgi:hypothetical protein